jgi:hypothetical protein
MSAGDTHFISAEEAMRQIRRAIDTDGKDWRYSVRRTLRDFYDTAWREGYRDGHQDCHAANRDEVVSVPVESP